MTRLIVLATLAASSSWADPPATSDAPALVREMAAQELAVRRQQPASYRYQRRFESSKGVWVTDRVATRDGIAERLVSVDGHPPTAEQRDANARLLDRLARDAKFQQTRLKSDQEEEERIRQLFEAFPEAFHFQFDGTDPDPALVRLRCQRDPSFHPRSRETLVLRGMEARLWIHKQSHRLARFEGTLVEDVDLGWGFLARVYPGGKFLFEQSRIADGTWQMTAFQDEFDGRILLVKSLRLREKQALSSFQRLPDNLTLSGAIHLLLAPRGTLQGN